MEKDVMDRSQTFRLLSGFSSETEYVRVQETGRGESNIYGLRNFEFTQVQTEICKCTSDGGYTSVAYSTR